MVVNEEINQLALDVAKSFRQNPLFGVDVIYDYASGKFFVIEANLGGNVWHFSSSHGREKRGIDYTLRKLMIMQYKAWDRASEALVRYTNQASK